MAVENWLNAVRWHQADLMQRLQCCSTTTRGHLNPQSGDLTWLLAHLAVGLTLWACHPCQTLRRWWGQGCCLPFSSGPPWWLLGTPLLTDVDTGADPQSALVSAWQNRPFWEATKDFFFIFLSWISHRNVSWHLLPLISQCERIFVTDSGRGGWALFFKKHTKYRCQREIQQKKALIMSSTDIQLYFQDNVNEFDLNSDGYMAL